MKNQWFLLFSLCFLLACGSESSPKKVAVKPAETKSTTSTTALNTAKNSTALAAPNSTDEKARVQDASTPQKGDKAEAIKEKSQSKAEHLANKAKKVNTAPSKKEEQTTKPSSPGSATTKPSTTPVKKVETPKPATQPVSTPKPTVPKSEAPVKVEEKEPPVEAAPPAPPVFNHDAWDALLRKNVSSTGKVNYKGFKKDIGALDDYLADLQNNPIQSDWSKNQKIAYWINAYNAFTVKLIVDNYPLGSITELHGGKAWQHKWIKLGDKTYTLNNIENDILRPQYKDARVHFAVNCAAKSCPPLLNRAWTKGNVDRYYEKQAKAFINNTQYNKISADKVEISKIFEWYAADFGDLIGYLNIYSDTKINPGAKISYIEYDWKLNE